MNGRILTKQQFFQEEQGAASIEYALLGSLIAAVVAATVVVLGAQVQGAFCSFLINFAGSC